MNEELNEAMADYFFALEKLNDLSKNYTVDPKCAESIMIEYACKTYDSMMKHFLLLNDDLKTKILSK